MSATKQTGPTAPAHRHGARRGMLVAVALLGSSTLITTLAGVLAAKLRAVWLQPAGFGLYSLEAALLSFLALLAGAGVGVTLVRLGSGADPRRFWALRRAAWRLAVAAAVAVGVALLLSPRPWLDQWLHYSLQRWEVAVLAAALVVTVLAGLQGSILAAVQDLRGLARAAILAALLGGAANLTLIWLWREQGVAPALLVSAVTLFLGQAWYLRRHPGPLAADAEPGELRRDCWALAAKGVPYMAAMLAGGGVQILLPYLVAAQLGLSGAGIYRGAARLAVAYMMLLATALGQDYLPRISQAAGDRQRLQTLINDQHWILMLLAIPAVLAGMAVLPSLLGLLYTPAFASAGGLLRWQLSGDILRFSCWSYSFVLLVVCGSGAFLLTEILSGAATLACTWYGLRWWGLTGAGIGYVISYVWYWGVVWFVLRRRLRVRLTRANRSMLAAGLAAAGIVLAFAALPRFQIAAAVLLLVLLGGPALWLLRREWNSVPRVRGSSARMFG